MKKKNDLRILDFSVFFQTQLFLLPVLFLFYQHCGLSVGDFFLFQGIFSLAGLLFEVPAGYLGDLFPKKNILILSYSFFVVRLILWLFFAQYGYWIIFMGEILYAAQKATFSGASDSYVYEYLKYNNISQKMLKKYGKMNFFMSIGTSISSLLGAWLYNFVSQWSLVHYQHDYGFIVLIVLELILNLTAIYLLSLLPNLPAPCSRKRSLGEGYNHFFKILIWTIRNRRIRYHMFYSGLLAATTVVFIWGFQPIMKYMMFPVALYGVVYFINHILRAGVSLYLNKIMKYIPLSHLVWVVFFMFVASFSLTFIVLNVQPLPVYLNLMYFVFVSLTIAFQLTFYLSHTSRIHQIIPSGIRTTISSVNVAIGRFWAGFFFILLKILMDGVTLETSFSVCFIIFLIASVSIRKVYPISKQDEKIA